MVSAHALSQSIQSSTESTTYDLSGLSPDAISNLLASSLSSPLPLQQMIRLTFVVGAGKQARQKYDASATKAVTAALSEKCGFVEDRGASMVDECGGSYKLQHDTAKNLKTVVVFPKIGAANGSADGSEDATNADDEECLIPPNSPGHKVAASSVSTFQSLLKAQCVSWSDKRGCLESIRALQQLSSECDAKLMSGTPLDAAEQSFYDLVDNLSEKETRVKQEMSRMVDEGKLTKFELEILLQQNAERVVELETQNKDTSKAKQRRERLEAIQPISPARLRHEPKLVQLHRELAPLIRMEDEARGRLLSVKETQTLSRKEELLDEVAYYEEASQGWFEDDEVFEVRLKAARQRYAVISGKGVGGKKVGGGSRAAATKSSLSKIRARTANNARYVTPGGSQCQGWSSAVGGKKKKKGKGGAVFTAVMLDSDSDSDEEEDEDEEEEDKDEDDDEVAAPLSKRAPSNDAIAPKEPPKAPPPSSSSKKNKSKKKKKKKGGNNSGSNNNTTNEVPAQNSGGDNTNAEGSTEKGEQETEGASALTQVVQVSTYLIKLLVQVIGMMLAWVVGMVFGSGKSKKKKKQKGT